VAFFFNGTNEVEDSCPTVGIMVADGRYTTPLDVDLVHRLADFDSLLVTVEGDSNDTFSDHVLHFLSLDGLLDDGEL
jgi:1-deoxy-D-xylulose-5-phosphate synthase